MQDFRKHGDDTIFITDEKVYYQFYSDKKTLQNTNWYVVNPIETNSTNLSNTHTVQFSQKRKNSFPFRNKYDLLIYLSVVDTNNGFTDIEVNIKPYNNYNACVLLFKYNKLADLVKYSYEQDTGKLSNLKTSPSVEHFLAMTFFDELSDVHVEYDTSYMYLRTDTSNNVGFKIIDINEDGYNDMIIYQGNMDGDVRTIPSVNCILDTKEKYKFYLLEEDILNFLAAYNVTKISVISEPALCAKVRVNNSPDHLDTIVYKYNNFLEYSEHHSTANIDKIVFTDYGCFWHCPEFELSINNRNELKYKAKKYNFSNGKFKAKIDTGIFESLSNILHYIDFITLKDTFTNHAYDVPSYGLKIYYDNGVIKEIYDHGPCGPKAFDDIYNIFFDIRKNTTWH